MKFDTDRIDDAVLALLQLGLHEERRAWKSFDWDAMNRLFEKGFICDPAGKAKSVILTDEGLARSARLFREMFTIENVVGTEMESRLAALAKEISELREAHEARIAGLENSAALFEEHRQSTIRLNEKLRELKEEMDRDGAKEQERKNTSADRRARRDNMIRRGMIKPEDAPLAVLFDMVLEHCTDAKGRLNSWGRAPYTHALHLLAEAEFIRIDEESGDSIVATPLPKGDRACEAMAPWMPCPNDTDGQTDD